MKYFRATIDFEWDNNFANVKTLEVALENLLPMYNHYPKLQVADIKVEEINKEETNEK